VAFHERTRAQAVVKAAVDDVPSDTPIFIYGESMGGAVAIATHLAWEVC